MAKPGDHLLTSTIILPPISNIQIIVQGLLDHGSSYSRAALAAASSRSYRVPSYWREWLRRRLAKLSRGYPGHQIVDSPVGSELTERLSSSWWAVSNSTREMSSSRDRSSSETGRSGVSTATSAASGTALSLAMRRLSWSQLSRFSVRTSKRSPSR